MRAGWDCGHRLVISPCCSFTLPTHLASTGQGLGARPCAGARVSRGVSPSFPPDWSGGGLGHRQEVINIAREGKRTSCWAYFSWAVSNRHENDNGSHHLLNPCWALAVLPNDLQILPGVFLKVLNSFTGIQFTHCKIYSFKVYDFPGHLGGLVG